MISAPGAPGPPEVGFVATRRVGNAVRRNRAKRRLREAAARVRLRPNTAYVVVATPEVLEADFGTLVRWLEEAVAGPGEERG